jgi:hypothetical protein
MKHIAIISYGCSGTNAIVDQLLNNSNFWFHENKEPLNVNREHYNGYLKDGDAHWYNDHISKMIKSAEKEGKLLLIHIKPMHFLGLKVDLREGIEMLSDKFDFVTIKRNNYLAILSSGHFKKARKIKGSKTVTIDENKVKSIFNIFQRMDLTNSAIQEYTKPNTIHIDYEKELNVDTRNAADKITKFYNIFEDYKYERKRHNFHAKKNQWSNILLKEKLNNFKNIEKELYGTIYEWMLKE